MKTEIIEYNGRTLKVVEVLKNKEDERITFFKKWSNKKFCLEAVKQDGNSLQYVKEQTEEICLEAVKQDGDSLRYVKEQTIFETITKLKIPKATLGDTKDEN